MAAETLECTHGGFLWNEAPHILRMIWCVCHRIWFSFAHV